MTQEWKMTTGSAPSQLYAGAYAGVNIAKRQGAGKMRHINVKCLWLQEKGLQKRLPCVKVKGEDNPSYGLTKHFWQELAERYSHTLNLGLGVDRAKTSLQLTSRG